MPGEKKRWQLPTPFRRFSGKQDLPLEATGHSRRRVSSVYLSDNSSTGRFIVVPEFDCPGRADTPHDELNHQPHLPNLSAVAPSSPSSPNGNHGTPYNFELVSSCGSYDTSVIRDDDFTRRLSSAYEHIRSMPSAGLPKVLLSSDPQMLRKQLGVPQHSVLNYPIHSPLDLPNPYTLSHEPTSPKSPPVPSATGVSYARPSKKNGLHPDTTIFPLSPRHRSTDPSQLDEGEFIATAPVLPVDSPSGRGWFEEPRSARLVCTSKPQLSISDSSNLAKRCAEKPIVPPSCQLFSKRQRLRGVSRKPAGDTPSSNNASKRQVLLPQIRPPSPFKVDIPLHHTWHDRRTDFNSPPQRCPRALHFHERKTRRMSGSTDVLASLAWTGTSPIASGPHTVDRRRRLTISPSLPDRLSMAIVVGDDSISDDVLVDQLEKVREISSSSRRGEDMPSSWSRGHFPDAQGGTSEVFYSPCASSSPPTAEPHVKLCDAPLRHPGMSKNTTSESDDAAVWYSAKKALLCIREIVRTEKKYQEAIKMLLNAQTATPPPPSMIPYVSALVRASEMLLGSFLEDPSAWGVSTAFVTSEDELEATMVSWCTIAGGFFTDENDPQSRGLTGKWRFRKSGMVSTSSPGVTKQTSTSSTTQLPPMFSTISSFGRIKERMEEDCFAEQYTQTEKASPLFLHKPESTNHDAQPASGQPPSRKLSVRDLAIQPIQRVMRYVLLYKDLLDCTPPTSPSRLLAERALGAATRIANHCNRAQRNPAFCHASVS